MLKFKFAKFPMMDIDDGLSIGTGVEEMEAADPSESEEGVEEPEVADPAEEVTKGPTDSAWAEMRRRAEEAERQAQEADERNQIMAEALGMYFPGEDPVEMAIQARAAALGVDPEVERERFEIEREKEQLAEQNQTLEEQLNQMKIERLMEQGLSEIKAIDPSVNDLSQLGADFPKYIAAGLTSTEAYFAVKAKEAKTKVNPPKPIGKVESAPADSDFFTREEVDAMSDEELDKNFAAIRKSMSKWK